MRTRRALILIGWFFFTFWDGRIERHEFLTKGICEETRAEMVLKLREWRVSTICRLDSR